MINPQHKLARLAQRRAANRARKAKQAPQSVRIKTIPLQTWTKAQTALPDDPYALAYEREQGQR